MRRLITYGLVGAAVGIVAAVIGNLLMPKQAIGDIVSLGGGVNAAKLYSLNRAYEIVGYLLLGSLLSPIIAVLANANRSTEVKTRSFIVGSLLGGPLCVGTNALIHAICLAIARRYSPDLIITQQQSSAIHDLAFLLHYALMPTALAIALTVAVGVNGFTIQRGLISAGLGAVVSGITIHLLFFIIAPIMIMGAMNSGGVREFDLSALLKPLLIAHLLGMGLGAAVAFGVVQILYRAAWLRGMNGPFEGRHLPISSPVAVMGCQPNVQIPLPADGSIAPVHAQIDSSEDSHLIRPLAGEVLVNGVSVQEAWLADNDVVQVGAYRFQYRNRLPPADPNRATIEPPRIAGSPATPTAAPTPAPARGVMLKDAMGGAHMLKGGCTILGRDESVAISLPWEPTVSRRHAEIQLGPSGCSISDLGSSNSTFVNGVQISGRQAIVPGDEVRLGKCVLRVEPHA